jgi:hypothetical protein
MRLFLLLLLFLLGVVVVKAQSPCNNSALWALCQLDDDCALLYRHDGAGGIADAMAEFATYAAHNRPLPHLPAGWSPTTVGINPLGDCSSSISSASISTTSFSQLAWLIRYRAFLAGTAGLGAASTPYTTQVYDSVTGDYYAACAEGHVCTSDTTTAPADANSADVLAIVVSSSVLAFALILLGYVIVQQRRTHALLFQLLAVKKEPAHTTVRSASSLELYTSSV